MSKKDKLPFSPTQTIVLPSDPNKLAQKLRLLYQQRIAGNDSKLISKEIEAIVDTLLKYDIINNNQHQNILENLQKIKMDQFRAHKFCTLHRIHRTHYSGHFFI